MKIMQEVVKTGQEETLFPTRYLLYVAFPFQYGCLYFLNSFFEILFSLSMKGQAVHSHPSNS